jgi:Fe-S cluster assembly ATP-binding protein
VSTLRIVGLRAGVGGKEILRGIDLTVSSGEVHAVMGPNGSGKSTLSHVLMGRPGYEVLGGEVLLDGRDLLALPTHERAAAGLFLAMQYPTEVPGVAVEEMLTEALVATGKAPARAAESGKQSDVHGLMAAEAIKIGFDERFLSRPLNVDLSGGEKKRNETLQLGVLAPKIAILDEIDSGLDVDALRAVSRRVEALTTEIGLGVLAITHYRRLLTELRPDGVHVLVKGRIVASGGSELADELEVAGYAAYLDGDEEQGAAAPDPFADPLA